MEAEVGHLGIILPFQTAIVKAAFWAPTVLVPIWNTHENNPVQHLVLTKGQAKIWQ